MRTAIILTILVALGACDVPNDDNIQNLEEPIETSESGSESESESGSESGDEYPVPDFVLAPPPPVYPEPLPFGMQLRCDKVPDRTAYGWVLSDQPWPEQCQAWILETGLLWATIEQPNYETNLLAIFEEHKDAWGAGPWEGYGASYIFGDLTPDP